MLKRVMANREFLITLVYKDLKGRYIGSAMGIFWNVLNPLIIILVYTFVFSYVMKTKLPASAGTDKFVLFLFCGMIPWTGFAESITRSTTVISDNSNLVKKFRFPPEILVVYIVISSFIHQLIALFFLIVLLAAWGHPLGGYALFLPIVFIFNLSLNTGLSFFLASANVFIRDVSHILGALMLVLFFATPIVYPLEFVPLKIRVLMSFNPLVQLVEIYRDLLLRNQFHSIIGVAYFVTVSIVILFLGKIIFVKTSDSFADII